MTGIPAFCPSCGALFPSRAMGMMFGGGHVKGVTLRGNVETCPHCGGLANIADGVFDIAGDVITVVSAPRITMEMLAAFRLAVQKAYTEKKPPETLAKEVEKIDPAFGDVIRKSGNNYLLVLLLIILAIKSCSVSVGIKLDVNRLIEQMQNTPPAAVISAPEPPATEPQAPMPP
jgi:hypothetical protein